MAQLERQLQINRASCGHTSISTPSGLESTPLFLSLPLPLFSHERTLILQLIDIRKVASAGGHTGRILPAETAARPSGRFRDSPRLLLDWRSSDRYGSRSRSSRLLGGRTVEGLHRCSTDGDVGISRRSSSIVRSRVMPHYMSA